MALKAEKQVKFIVDSDDFDRFVEECYGGSFEIVAINEMNNNSYYDFNVGGKNYTLADEKLEAKIRSGEYPTYCLNHVIKCLIEDGHLTEEGNYEIQVNW